MKVKKLKNGKFTIETKDNKVVTYEDVILKNNILYKNELNDNDLKKIEQDNLYYNIYNI